MIPDMAHSAWIGWIIMDYPYETLFRKSHSFSSQKRNASIIHPCLSSELYWRFIRCTKPRTLHTVMGSARRSNTCYPKTAQNIQKHPTTWHSIFNTTVGKNQDHKMHICPLNSLYFCKLTIIPVFLPIEWFCSSPWVILSYFSHFWGVEILQSSIQKPNNFIYFTASLQGVRKLKDSISWNNSLWGGTDSANFLRSKFSRIHRKR